MDRWDIEWWRVQVNCITDRQIYNNPHLGYCNSTDNLCNGPNETQWVGLPIYIEQDLNDWGNYSFNYNNDTFAHYGTWFMQQANASKPRSVQNELVKQAHNISEMAKGSYYSEYSLKLSYPMPYTFFMVDCTANKPLRLPGLIFGTRNTDGIQALLAIIWVLASL